MNDLDPKTDKSPFEVWACYIPGKDKQRNYLSNGKTGKDKGLRLFKSEQAAKDFLKLQLDTGKLSQTVYDSIIIEPIEGKLALPADIKPVIQSKTLGLSAPIHLDPIVTLHRSTVPNAVELLDNYLRRQRNKPKKGK